MNCGSDPGYRMVASDGGIFSFCQAFLGSMGGQHLNAPMVGMAETPGGAGYWEVASDGGIFSYGNAAFWGSTGSIHLNRPIVGMAATPDGNGYWLVASDGGIFSYGDAHFYGSTGSIHLNKPIVGMAATPDGNGYWLVASDGGIFSYGDAVFDGSRGGQPLNKPIVGMASSRSGHGYWLVASDGGIFTYGDATFDGSAGSVPLAKPIVGMQATSGGGGYWLVASDGGIFSYGDAVFNGSTGRPGAPGADRGHGLTNGRVETRPSSVGGRCRASGGTVRLAGLEAQTDIEAVGRLPVGARREVHRPGAHRGGAIERGLDQRRRRAGAARRFVDHDILYPGPHARRDLEGRQRQHAHDGVAVAGDEQRGGAVGHNPLQDGAAGRRRGAGELGHQAVDRGAEVVVDRGGGLDPHHDVADSPRHIGWRTLS